MQQSIHHFLRLSAVFILLATFCIAMTNTTAQADDGFITSLADGYRTDYYETTHGFDTFGMIDQNTVLLSAGGDDLRAVDLDSDAVIQNLGQPEDGYFASHAVTGTPFFNIWTSFVEKSPIDGSYWIGFTTSGNSDDRIYQISSEGTWTHQATLAGNQDLEFYGNDLFVSANASGTSEPNNQIFKLDTTGNNNYQALASTGGYSAGLGCGEEGVYYATCLASVEGLYRFADQDIQAALAGGPAMELGQATKLVDTSIAASDTEVDTAEHVVFNANIYATYGQVLIYDETNPGSLTTLAVSASDAYLTGLETEGDVLLPGGAVYVAAAGYGIAKITKLIPGDANGDGRVDGSDVTIVANHWQHGVSGSADADWAMGDFNTDGKVDGSDVTIMANHWQESLSNLGVNTPAAAVPEPSMIVLLTILGLVIGIVRRR